MLFNPAVRHRCRNPQCKVKLKAPVENQRDAFCTSGCFNIFYRSRCLICEGPLERKTGNQRVCRRRSCRNAFRRLKATGRRFGVQVPSTVVLTPEVPDLRGSAEPIRSDRSWRIIAGPVEAPDGVRRPALGTAYDLEVLRANFRTNAKFWDEAALIKRHDPPINVLDCYRFANAPNVNLKSDCGPSVGALPSRWSPIATTIGADLEIPPFLKRRVS